MKARVSKKVIQDGYTNIISVGYCDLHRLLSNIEPCFYTSGLYVWNADVYHIDNDTCIVMGYRPFGNIKASFMGITSKYESLAKEAYTSNDYYVALSKIDNLLKEFINECLEGRGDTDGIFEE